MMLLHMILKLRSKTYSIY